MKSGPSDGYRIDARLAKLEDKVENLARAVEAIHEAIADARAVVVARQSLYVGAGTR